MSYDDDDFEIGKPRRRDRDREHNETPTFAGVYGFIAALVALGLLTVVVVLFIFLKQERQNPEMDRLMSWWFLILDAVSFVAALIATILGARACSPTNAHYRGYAVSALVLGILEMVVTVVFGLIMTCFVLVFEAMRNVPAG